MDEGRSMVAGERSGLRRRAATRERMLDAARDVLATEGIQGAAVEHICERAGFTRGAFYSNFTSKDDLLLALFQRERETMFRNLRKATEPDALRGLQPAEAIGVMIKRFIGLQPVDRVGLLVHMEFAIRGMRGDEVGEQFNLAWREVKDELIALMSSILPALGRELTVNPRHAATVLIGTYDEALREAIIEGREVDLGLFEETLPLLLLSATRPAPVPGAVAESTTIVPRPVAFES